MDEALRIARKYAADVRDTGKVEVCKNGISRIVFEVCETQLDEDGDIVDEDTIEIVDPLDRMPELRELADKADRRRVRPDYLQTLRRRVLTLGRNILQRARPRKTDRARH